MKKIVALALSAALFAGAADVALAATDLPLGAAVTAQIEAATTAAQIADIVAASPSELAPTILARALETGQFTSSELILALVTRTPQPVDVTAFSLGDAVAWTVEADPTNTGPIVSAVTGPSGLALSSPAPAGVVPEISSGVLAGLGAALRDNPDFGQADYDTQAQSAGAVLVSFLADGETLPAVMATDDDVEPAFVGGLAGGPAVPLGNRPGSSGNPSVNQ